MLQWQWPALATADWSQSCSAASPPPCRLGAWRGGRGGPSRIAVASSVLVAEPPDASPQPPALTSRDCRRWRAAAVLLSARASAAYCTELSAFVVESPVQSNAVRCRAEVSILCSGAEVISGGATVKATRHQPGYRRRLLLATGTSVNATLPATAEITTGHKDFFLKIL